MAERADSVDKRPSTCIIMALTKHEIAQVYEIKQRLYYKKKRQYCSTRCALRFGHNYFGFSTKWHRARNEVNIFIKELEYWRPDDVSETPPGGE